MSHRGSGKQFEARRQQQPSQRGGANGRGRGRRGRSSGFRSAQPAAVWVPVAANQAATASSSSSVPQAESLSAASLSRDIEGLTLHPSIPTEAPGIKSLEASIKVHGFPQRPGYGRIGNKCVVRANHFLVRVADRDLHKYDVSITPEMTSKTINREVIRQLVAIYCESHLGTRMPAYDGMKSLYTAGPLPFFAKEFIVKLVGKEDAARSTRKEREFRVAVKFVAKVDLRHLQHFLHNNQLHSPHDTIQALDVVLRELPSKNCIVLERSFFSPNLGSTGGLGNGVEYWRGYYQSLRPTQMGLSLNIDVSATSFYEPIQVTRFVEKYLNFSSLTRALSNQDRIKIKKALTGVKVNLTHVSKRYKIRGVTSEMTSQLMFPLGDGRRISVVEYYRNSYQIELEFAYLPALQAGSDKNPIYLPMELCEIVKGQRYSKKLNEWQVAELLKATCQRPSARERSIKQMVRQTNLSRDRIVSEEFGIDVRDELTLVNARVLPPPMLVYDDNGSKTSINPSVGRWTMMDKKMVNGGTVEYWTCVNFSLDMRPDMLNRFCERLVSTCSSKGMVFEPNPLLPIQSAHPGQIEKTLRDIHVQSNARLASMGQMGKQLQLLIIILPDEKSYRRIKRVCETELGIVSQCCKCMEERKLNNSYFESLALKINVKVGGRNTVLRDALERNIPLVSDRRTIIFGADVTHSQPGEDRSPSIAAVVASMDWPEVTKYRGLVSAQPHRQEIIADLYTETKDPQQGTVHGGMIRELLVAFYRLTKERPERIIIYRDGIGEGQFSQVLLYEIDAIRKACASLEEYYQPPVTFVVVQKRHHTRLFPVDYNSRSLTDKSFNVLAGTVIDTDICHPTQFDFYLNSHAGVQGTSRPAHYRVLFDENNFSADDMQTLTNSLCYTFARCTRSVSVVPPVYYAHLAAFRARLYMDDNEASESGGNVTRERNMEVRPLPAVKENVKDVMFYC